MPVTLLAFPDEQDLLAKIADGAPKLPYAEIVRVRHNLCHGNIFEHIITASDGLEPVRIYGERKSPVPKQIRVSGMRQHRERQCKRCP